MLRALASWIPDVMMCCLLHHGKLQSSAAGQAPLKVCPDDTDFSLAQMNSNCKLEGCKLVLGAGGLAVELLRDHNIERVPTEFCFGFPVGSKKPTMGGGVRGLR